MGFLDSVGVSENFLGNFSIAGLGGWAVLIFLFFFVVLITGGITFYYFAKKASNSQFKHKVPIFINSNGKMWRIDVDSAKEIFVPDTNISLFFLKKRKIYIARPTRSMGLNEFWYAIADNGEWINFDMINAPGTDTLASANYDHRDTRYAYVNLKEIIKRNYKDKAVTWWKEYSPIITFVIVSFVFLLGCWILLSKIGGLIKELGVFTEQFKIISQSLETSVKMAQNLNSGVIPG